MHPRPAPMSKVNIVATRGRRPGGVGHRGRTWTCVSGIEVCSFGVSKHLPKCQSSYCWACMVELRLTSLIDGSRGLVASAAAPRPNIGCIHCLDVVDSFTFWSLCPMGRSTF